MRVVLAALLVPCALAVVVGAVLLAANPWSPVPRADGSSGAVAAAAQQSVDGRIVRAGSEVDCSEPSRPVEAAGTGCIPLRVAVDEGPGAGRELGLSVPVAAGTPRFATGDAVVLAYSGGDPTDAGSYQVVDFQRGVALWALGALFALAVVALGRWQGVAALAALGVTVLVLGLFVLPSILDGSDPVAVALVAAGLVVLVVFPLTHGFSARTATAVLARWPAWRSSARSRRCSPR